MMAQNPKYAEIKPEDAAALVKSNAALLVDVRTPEEFEKGHFEGAVNIPVKIVSGDGMVDNPDFDEQVKEKLGDKKEARIICTCFGGGRGGVASGKLVDWGYNSISNMVGGMGAWAKAGEPVVGEIAPRNTKALTFKN
ncbi:hypothetical protein Ndes2437B_g02469 [Nannochloris sp. 'desiccata']